MGRSIRDSVTQLTVSISDNFSYCIQVVSVSESERSLKKKRIIIELFIKKYSKPKNAMLQELEKKLLLLM